MIPLSLSERLIAAGCSVTLCGSRVTCNPAPLASDYDYLVVAPNMQATTDAVDLMRNFGFTWEGSIHYQNAASEGFMSWRLGALNLIVTNNADFAHRHRVATSLCARLNLMDKQDRIAVFQAVLYAKEYPQLDGLQAIG